MVAGNLDSQGILTLYKAQIRPCMEYGVLSWMSAAPTHTRRLDAVQRRALRLLGDGEEIPNSITSLEHRRDVAALTVCHKTQVLHTPLLHQLGLAQHHSQRVTRQVPACNLSVLIPSSRSSQHLRTYKARTARLWNAFTAAMPGVEGMTTQQAREAANTWRASMPTPFLPYMNSI